MCAVSCCSIVMCASSTRHHYKTSRCAVNLSSLSFRELHTRKSKLFSFIVSSFSRNPLTTLAHTTITTVTSVMSSQRSSHDKTHSILWSHVCLTGVRPRTLHGGTLWTAHLVPLVSLNHSKLTTFMQRRTTPTTPVCHTHHHQPLSCTRLL